MKNALKFLAFFALFLCSCSPSINPKSNPSDALDDKPNQIQNTPSMENSINKPDQGQTMPTAKNIVNKQQTTSSGSNMYRFMLIGFMTKAKSDIDIATILQNGSGFKNLTENSSGSILNPSWAPDGQEIGFIDPSNGITIMNSDGSNRRIVDPHFYNFIDWSPTGDWLLGINIDDKDGWKMTLISPQGSGQKLLLGGKTGAPATVNWSSDGKSIAYVFYTEGFQKDKLEQVNQIRIIDIDGKNDKEFVTYPLRTYVDRISWLDGENRLCVGTITYPSKEETGTKPVKYITTIHNTDASVWKTFDDQQLYDCGISVGQLAVKDMKDGQFKMIRPSDGITKTLSGLSSINDDYVTFSPDGNWAAYVDRAETQNIYTVDLKSMKATTIHNPSEMQYWYAGYSWSPVPIP